MRVPFTFQSYDHESSPLSSQRLINCYPEVQPRDAKAPIALLPRPGKKLFAGSVGAGPIRGVHEMDEVGYAVSGARLYSFDASGTETDLGSIGTNATGLVSMEDNGNQLVVVNDNTGYVYDRLLNSLNQITDPDFPEVNGVAQLDGYHIFPKLNDDQWIISALRDPTDYDPLDFATAEGAPDDLVAIEVDQRQLLLFGKQTTEFWYNSGASFPFDRISGAYLQIGLAAKHAAARVDNTVYWPGNDGTIYRLAGVQAQRVSTHAVEQAIQAVSGPGDAQAISFRQKGHHFYVLTYAGQKTLVHDANTGLWHDWQSYGENEFLGCCHARVYGQDIIGDPNVGKLYTLDPDTRDDDGDPIIWQATSAPYYATGQWAFMASFEAVFETGVGLTTGQGSDPQVMLQFSDDGGRTWSPEFWRTLGQIGQYKTRAVWRRLGSFRERMIRLTVSDPVITRLLGANAEIIGQG